ncbi:MAG: LysE family transporter [Vitreoscilla sp.]|nr:LysE family transporter [Vitreoscilla sp.]
MELFLLVAGSHFLALLLPGADFFLIVRLAARSGWRACVGLCSGIAVGNACYVVLAFTGLQVLQQTPVLLWGTHLLGTAYLLYLSVLLLWPRAQATTLAPPPLAHHANPMRHFGMGLLSALLNPKNGLFYMSLASVLSQQQASLLLYVACAVWMVSVVWLWDMAVAILLGNPVLMRRFQHWLPQIERGAGVMLGGLALAMVWQALQALA